MQAPLSYSGSGPLGPWTQLHSCGGWAGRGWRVQEAFTHRAGAWAPLHVASPCPRANLSFLITWWSSGRKTSHMTAGIPGETLQTTKAEPANLAGLSFSRYRVSLLLHPIAQNRSHDQARFRGRTKRPHLSMAERAKNLQPSVIYHDHGSLPRPPV